MMLEIGTAIHGVFLPDFSSQPARDDDRCEVINLHGPTPTIRPLPA